MPETNRKLRVFLCHASQDKPVVRELYQRLLAEGWIDPWLDEEKLLPGQDWDMEIEKAVEAADAVIVCVSKGSVTKEGYVQKEIRKVLDISDQKPEGSLFIIPLRLEECEPPRRLASRHYVDYFPFQQRDGSYARIVHALNIRSKIALSKPKEIDKLPTSASLQRTSKLANRNDHHSALRSEQMSKISSGEMNFVLAKLQWGKNEVGYSLHAEPTSFSTYGMQATDFLYYLGFKRENCSFVTRRECYTTWVDPEFNVSDFAQNFNEAFSTFEKAARLLENCGHMLDQPEGWGYFYGKASQGRSNYQVHVGGGDGHTSNQSKLLKELEDDYFYYKLSWIENNTNKGWVFHYRFKENLSQYLISAFNTLNLKKFEECPYFDFENCHWIYDAHQTKGDSYFDSNARFVYQAFDASPNNFPLALQMLVQANNTLLPLGFSFLKG